MSGPMTTADDDEERQRPGVLRYTLVKEVAMHTNDDDDDCYDEYNDYDDYEDPPLYADGEMSAMDEAQLQKEWQRQCRIHDRGVDNLPMNHPTIEDAHARLSWVEAEQTRRGFKTGPGDRDDW